MDKALIAAGVAIVVAIISAIVGPILVERYKRRNAAPPRIDPPMSPTARQETTTPPPAPVSEVATLVTPLLEESSNPLLSYLEEDDPAKYPKFLRVETLPSGPPVVFMMEDSPFHFASALDPIPPLSRGNVAAELYKGRWVRWSGRVTSIQEMDRCYSVHVLDHLGAWIVLTFTLRSRPEVDLLRVGDYIEFQGQILSAGRKDAELVWPQITLHRPLAEASTSELKLWLDRVSGHRPVE